MARSLEETRPNDAVQSGRSALGALDEAKKMLQKGAWFEDPSGTEQKSMESARRKLEAEVQWAEQQRVELMRKRAAERARKQLEEGGGDEDKLADRARELRWNGRGDKVSLPQRGRSSPSMDAEHGERQAAQALKQGDADKGLEKQREAQRALESALQQLEGDGEESGGNGPPVRRRT